MPPRSWILRWPEFVAITRAVRWPGDRGQGNMFEESPGSTERRCRITAGGGDPRDSATEMTPPKTLKVAARLKWCGKSAPRLWQQRRHGKPHREQDQIGTARDVFRIAVRVGRVRCVATHIPEEWSSLRAREGQNPAYRPSDIFFSPSVFASQALLRPPPPSWLRAMGEADRDGLASVSRAGKKVPAKARCPLRSKFQFRGWLLECWRRVRR